jgi:hypothetical protein
VGVVSVHWQFWAFLVAGALVLAVPTEYLCYRRGWGLGVRLLTWAAGAAYFVVLPLFAEPIEDMCSTLDKDNCDDLKRVYASVLPIFAGLMLVLWSVVYATAATVCRAIYRRVLTRPRASP